MTDGKVLSQGRSKKKISCIYKLIDHVDTFQCVNVIQGIRYSKDHQNKYTTLRLTSSFRGMKNTPLTELQHHTMK